MKGVFSDALRYVLHPVFSLVTRTCWHAEIEFDIEKHDQRMQNDISPYM